MKTLKYLTLIFIVPVFALAQSAQPLKQKMEMRIDSIGNAKITVSMTMNAQQWQMWLQSMGNNPALLKRGIERELPAYFLDDFNLEKNDMERSFTLSLKAYGVTRVNKKGRWIVDTEQKDPEVTKLTDNQYMMMYTDLSTGLQQTQIIQFPSAAENIEIEKDSFGKTQFIFDMDTRTGGPGYTLWAGIALVVAGGGWMVAGMRK